MSRRWAIMINGVAFLFLFVVFFIWNFPVDAIVGHYLANVEKMSGGEFRIMHTQRKIGIIFDSVFEDLTIQRRTENGFRSLFQAAHIEVGFSLFSLLTGNYSFNFEADLDKNDTKRHLEGNVVWSSGRRAFELTFKKVPLHQFSYFIGNYGLEGDVDGELRIWLPNDFDIEKTNAEFRMQISNFSMKAIQFSELGFEVPDQAKGYFTAEGFPDMNLTRGNKKAYFEGGLKQGRIDINKIDIPGEQLILQLSGKMRSKGKKSFGFFTADLGGKFFIADEIKKIVLFMETFSTEISTDGYYDLTIKGPLNSLESYNIGKIQLSKALPIQ